MSPAVLLCCLTLLVQVSWTFGSDLRYKNLGRGQSGHSVQTTFQRFTRDEGNASVERDTHVYYRSTYYPPSHHNTDNLWLDLASMVDSGAATVDTFTAESQLSDLHRYYEVHNLRFRFPFYGHFLDSIAVTTGGFLYTGGLLHDKVAATQYIAPLQADFNPNHTDTGRVLVLNTEERFTVQWDKVHNHDHLNDGPFTFQVSIFPNGVIHFVYQEVPLLLDDIDNEAHPVEVGVADAFYVYERAPDGTGVLVTVYEYDRVSLVNTKNLTNSAYILSPLLSCISATTCEQCSSVTLVTTFDCGWCSELQRCSDGVDRLRQIWFSAGCNDQSMTCTGSPSSSSSSSSSLSTSARAGIGAAVIVVVLIAALVLLGLALFLYAYRTPTSRMGQFIIKYRPKARSLNKSKSTSYDVSSEKATLEEDLQ